MRRAFFQCISSSKDRGFRLSGCGTVHSALPPWVTREPLALRSRPMRQNFIRMQNLDVRIAVEIVGIERKDSDPEEYKPDLNVTLSIDDYLHGRDPVLDAGLHHSDH